LQICRRNEETPRSTEFLKEPEIIDSRKAGEMNDPIQPVPLNVPQRQVPLVVASSPVSASR
jgi:hypothetical protein